MSVKLTPDSTITCHICREKAYIDLIQTGEEEMRYILCYRDQESSELAYGTYCNQKCLQQALQAEKNSIGCYVCMKLNADECTFIVESPVNAMAMYRCCSTACRLRAMQCLQELNKGANVICNTCERSGQFQLKCPKCTVTTYCSEDCKQNDQEEHDKICKSVF